MFTGLVQDKARVAAVERNGGGVRLTVETRVEPIARGDSVCINGVCLTAVETGDGRFTRRRDGGDAAALVARRAWARATA